MRRMALVFSALLLLLVCSASARTWYITPDGLGDAPTIQAGIDSSTAGDTVLVACGTYCEHDITVKSGIRLAGESGEPECVTIDALEEGRVMLCDSVLGTAIEGLTLTGGLAQRGGGMLCRDSDVALVNNIFTANTAEGGIANGGGGIHVWGEIAPTVTGCVFSDNNAGWYGGGAWVQGPEFQVVFDQCVFRDNHADNYGGGLCCTAGQANLYDCWLEANVAEAGGGIAYSSGQGGSVLRCVFVRNRAYCNGSSGAAIHQEYGSVLVARSTFYENRCDAILVWACYMVIERTIVANSEGYSVRLKTDYGEEPEAYAECCDFFGNGCDWCPGMTDQLGRWGNIREDPMFCDPENDDFTLDAGSPCTSDNSPESCYLIGAREVGCANAGVSPAEGEGTNWGAIKAMFR
jgi:hypothetical protein